MQTKITTPPHKLFCSERYCLKQSNSTLKLWGKRFFGFPKNNTFFFFRIFPSSWILLEELQRSKKKQTLGQDFDLAQLKRFLPNLKQKTTKKVEQDSLLRLLVQIVFFIEICQSFQIQLFSFVWFRFLKFLVWKLTSLFFLRMVSNGSSLLSF